MNEDLIEARWYAVSAQGFATLCADENDARYCAKQYDSEYPKSAPHTVGKLVAAAAIESMQADIHSCHPNCARAGCVNERLRAELAAMRAWLPKVPIPPRAITYEHGVELLNELQRLAVAARSGETT